MPIDIKIYYLSPITLALLDILNWWKTLLAALSYPDSNLNFGAHKGWEPLGWLLVASSLNSEVFSTVPLGPHFLIHLQNA
jgi:hypothetical protein